MSFHDAQISGIIDNMDISKGTVIGGYRVERQLGRGGMSAVFEVVHPTLGVRLAMKVFDAEGERTDFLRGRLLVEGRVLARLEHSNLVKVHDCGFDDATGAPYIVMDLVLSSDGEPRTLSEMHAMREIDEERLFRWYADIASALAYVQSQGIVHRDVKPSNVLIAADGRAVLADFGVSRFSDEGLKRELAVEPTMATDVTTSSKVLLGTTSYLAPEVKRGEAATAKSDMYSLGVMLFRMLTGIWYEPGTGAMNLLGPFDPAWREILSALLEEAPAKRSMPPRRIRSRARLVFLAALCAVLALAAAAALAWSLAGRSASSRGDAGKSLPAQGMDGRALDDLFFVTK